jgi:hypothetical protein
VPQSAAPFLTFHVEHIQAQQHISDDSPDNLTLACPHCNLHKGPNVTSIDPDSREVIGLFNPRSHTWSDHFQLDGALIIGLTQPGRVTARLLNMNAEEHIEIRARLLARNEFAV